ncbi:DUF669 domain-containing protein [Senegalia massiliensis]|uniref:DUF669 domain-containing protein n=1 Tax=Senegalia massiliensis TaxID=1720316 RepID=A0A845QTB5_9CLOT|nr:DUF669 domain-containing protein [Senegalia massiliensis]NBI05785.1 DUF669 domain-containing protein [Senegalia massiliensis]
MAFFEVDHDDVFEGGLIDEGVYEVVVGQAYEDAAKTGTQFINLHLIVRNDIEQKFQNKYIFASIWQSKQTGEYHKGMLNSVAKALQVPNGKKFNSLEELLNEFKGRTARVTVKHEEYNDNTNARVKNWDQSKFNGCNHEFKNKVGNMQGMEGFQPVDDEDIPF